MAPCRQMAKRFLRKALARLCPAFPLFPSTISPLWKKPCRRAMSRPLSSNRSRARGSISRDLYLRGAQALCRKYGTLFVADEIQTGMGRTGRFLSVEHWGVEPDMVLLAKTLSGGHIPVGAVLMRKAIFDKMFNRMDRAVVHG